jgi:drug/metabolite transporter (DMT)-like permease
MQASAGPERRRAREGRLAILLAAVAWSTAGLGQRGLDASAVTQVAGRAFFAALALFALVLAMERRGTMRAFLGMGRSGLAMTVFLAISSGAFLLALNHTSVANVLFMQAAAPMMAALLGWVLISEPVDGRTWAALLLAGAGVAVMAAGSLDAGIAAVGLPLLMTASFASPSARLAGATGRSSPRSASGRWASASPS